MDNPFKAQHMEYEMAATGGEYTRAKAARVVAGEYEGREHAIECGKCGQLSGYYRATIGIWECTARGCGAQRIGLRFRSFEDLQAHVAAGKPTRVWR